MIRINQSIAPRRSYRYILAANFILAAVFLLAGGSILRAQALNEYSIPPSGGNSGPTIITPPDAAGVELFTESYTNSIGFFVPGFVGGNNIFYTACVNSSPDSSCPGSNLPMGITLGPPAGNQYTAWFTEYGTNQIGQMIYTPDSSPGTPYVPSSVTFNQYSTPTMDSAPYAITLGPDGAFWFTEYGGNNIGRITTAGVITEYPIPTNYSLPTGITVGPDNALWFTESNSGKIGRITTSGTITEFVVPTMNSGPAYITLGSDGALWFTERTANKIGSMTTSGVFAEYPVPTSNSLPTGITLGPDDTLWFTEQAGNQIGRITDGLDPQPGWISEFGGLTTGSQPWGIASFPVSEVFPAGGVSFAEYSGNNIGFWQPYMTPLNPGPCNLGAGVVGVAYSATCSTSGTMGGASPYSWSATGLPSPLTISSDGAITGTPATAGSYTVTITETDSTLVSCPEEVCGPQSASQVFVLNISNPLTLTCSAPPPGEVGVPYSSTPCTAGAGVPPYTFTAGNFPPGLTINSSTGAITGTPTTAGGFNKARVIVTDSLTPTAEVEAHVIPITIYPQLLLSCAAGTEGAVGTAYSSTPCAASGGDPPLLYTATGLPPGLTMDLATGVITGTPTTAGTYSSVVVTVTDSLTPTAQAAFQTISITITGKLTLTCSAGAGGVVGVAYSSTPCTAGGGQTPYTYSVTGLPPGLGINASTGAITGTPTTTGAYTSVVVTVTDSLTPNHQVTSQTISITIYGKLSLNCTAGVGGIVGVAYSSTPCAATGGDPALSYSATGLPPGLTINASTGAITGTPTTAGAYTSVTVTVTDSLTPTHQTSSQTISITITGALTLNCSAGVGGEVGVAYASTPCAASSGVTPYTYTATGLPPGLAINSSTGAITGTPTTAGAYTSVVVTVADSLTPTHQTAPQTISITIYGKLSLSCTAGVGGVAGAAYSSTPCAATGGDPALSYSATGLPPGLTINASTGAITGTPTTAGTYTSVTVTVTDSLTPTHQTAPQTISITIAGQLTLNCTAGVAGEAGVAYASTPCAASGGLTPNTYTATGLPPGLTINSGTGAITGTPTTAGAYTSVLVTATDSLTPTHQTESQTISITIYGKLTLSCTTGVGGVVGAAYSSTPCAATGGQPALLYSATGLPPGLTINASTGAITGTPTTTGAYTNVVVTVTDSLTPTHQTAPQTISITVISKLTLSCTGATAYVGLAFSSACSAAGGATPYHWSATGLPPGVSINAATGQITGSVTASGSFTVTVTVVDSSLPASQTASQQFTILSIARLTLNCSATAPGTVGAAYSATPCTVSGGTSPYNWTGSGLPPGLSVNPASGAIYGTPTAAGSYTGTVSVTDSSSSPQTGSQGLTIVINSPQLNLSCTTLSPVVVGANFSATPCSASGGTPPYAYSATGLPPGLSINQTTGAITGAPTTVNSFTGSVTVTDSSTPTKQSASQPVTIVVNPGKLSLTCSAAPQGFVATSYSANPCSASGGTPPYTYSGTGLPPGLSVNPATGAITGTPTTANSYSGSIAVTDSGTPSKQSASQPLTIVIGPAQLTLTCGNAPSGVIATSYSATPCSAGGGTPPYAYSGTGLPPGLSVNPTTGAITGTPTGANSYSGSITVTDSSTPTKQSASQPLTIVINPAQQLITVTCGSAPPGVVAISYSATPCSASGGTSPYGYTGSGLPPGLSVNPATGAITGTPTTAGPYTVTLTVTDSSPAKLTQTGSFTISILPGVTIDSLSLVSSSTTPAAQSSVTITLASPSADPLTGVICMLFQPNSAVVLPPAGINPYDASLANASASLLKQCPQGSISAASFTLGPNEPAKTSLATVSQGTVAGQITLQIVSLLDSTTSVLPAQNTSVTLTIPPAAPQVTSGPVIGSVANGAFTVSLTGYTSTRQLSEADFTFTPATTGGTTLNNNSSPVTIPVPMNNADQTQYFQTPASAGFGGSFSLTVSFPYSGDPSALGTVSVTLKNSQ